MRIVESRPYSKTKRWKVAEILSSIEIAEVQPEEISVDEDVLSYAASASAESSESDES